MSTERRFWLAATAVAALLATVTVEASLPASTRGTPTLTRSSNDEGSAAAPATQTRRHVGRSAGPPRTPSIYSEPPGGWTASPTFFAARSDAERRAAIELWLRSIAYESWEASGRSSRKQHPAGTMGVIRAYAVPWFEATIGKSYTELTKRDRKQLASWLQKTSRESWVKPALIQPLNQSPESASARSWGDLFANRRVPNRRLSALGEPAYVLKTRNVKTLVFPDRFGHDRVELLTSVHGYNSRGDTWETTQVTSSLVVVDSTGEILQQKQGNARVVVWLSDSDKSTENRESFLLDLGERTGVYLFLDELACRWGTSMRTVTWIETCAEAGGSRRGESIGQRTRIFADSLGDFRPASVAVGGTVEHAGWIGMRIR